MCGLVYEINPSDEASLDRSEVSRRRWRSSYNVGGEKSLVQGLVYIDEKRVEEGKPWEEEYIDRINMGINGTAARGLPRWYIDKHMHRYAPAEGERRPLRVSAHLLQIRLEVFENQVHKTPGKGEVDEQYYNEHKTLEGYNRKITGCWQSRSLEPGRGFVFRYLDDPGKVK